MSSSLLLTQTLNWGQQCMDGPRLAPRLARPTAISPSTDRIVTSKYLTLTSIRRMLPAGVCAHHTEYATALSLGLYIHGPASLVAKLDLARLLALRDGSLALNRAVSHICDERVCHQLVRSVFVPKEPPAWMQPPERHSAKMVRPSASVRTSGSAAVMSRASELDVGAAEYKHHGSNRRTRH